jgi:AraC-like DNA-binding protein
VETMRRAFLRRIDVTPGAYRARFRTTSRNTHDPIGTSARHGVGRPGPAAGWVSAV